MTDPRDRAPDDELEGDDREAIDDESVDLEREGDVDDLEGDDDLAGADEAEIDDYDAALREVAGEAVPAGPATAAERGSSTARRRTPGKQPSRALSPSEIAVHVRENASKVFVIAAVGIYIVILLNAVFLGTGGIFRPLPTPTPTPTESSSASPSVSAGPSGSVSASPATTPSASSSPSAAASPSAS